MKEQDKLLAFEPEELNMQVPMANPDIIISTHIRVNKELVIQDTFLKTKLHEFNIAEYKQNFIGEIEKRDRQTNG